MDSTEHFAITRIEGQAPPSSRTPTAYAGEVGERILAVFNHVGKQAPQLLRAAADQDAEQKPVTLTLTNVIPVNEKIAFFTVTASGMKWPLSYSFRSMALSGENFYVSPAGENYAEPHAQDPNAGYGYHLDDLDDGSAESFVSEMVGNYLTGLKQAAYDPPSESIVTARKAALLIN